METRTHSKLTGGFGSEQQELVYETAAGRLQQRQKRRQVREEGRRGSMEVKWN